MDTVAKVGYAQYIADFDKRHGPDFMCNSHVIIYSDGAWRTQEQPGPACDRHSEPVEHQKMIVQYWAMKSNNDAANFYDRKRAWERISTTGLPLDAEAAVAELKKLQEAAKASKARLEKEQNTLYDLQPHLRAADDARQQGVEMCRDLVARIKGIEL